MNRIIIYIFCVLLPVAGMAQEWVAERDALLEKIDAKVEAEINRKVKPEEVAASMGLAWPVEAASETASAIILKVRQEAESAADKEYPKLTDAELKQEVVKAYPLVKEGDEVNILSITKFTKRLKGRVYSISPGRIRIGTNWVYPGDLAEDDLARFYPQTWEKLLSKKVRLEKEKRKLLRGSIIREKIKEILPVQMKSGQYQAVETNDSSPKYYEVSNWKSKKELLEEHLEELRDEMDEAIRPGVEKSLMEENGFVWNATEEEWIKPGMAEAKPQPSGPAVKEKKSIFDKLKGIF